MSALLPFVRITGRLVNASLQLIQSPCPTSRSSQVACHTTLAVDGLRECIVDLGIVLEVRPRRAQTDLPQIGSRHCRSPNRWIEWWCAIDRPRRAATASTPGKELPHCRSSPHHWYGDRAASSARRGRDYLKYISCFERVSVVDGAQSRRRSSVSGSQTDPSPPVARIARMSELLFSRPIAHSASPSRGIGVTPVRGAHELRQHGQPKTEATGAEPGSAERSIRNHAVRIEKPVRIGAVDELPPGEMHSPGSYPAWAHSAG